MAEPLFEHWVEVRARLQAAGHVLIACDFDGTLSPIVDHPEDASILPACVDALGRLAELARFDVAIVSGRALDDVRGRAGIPGAIYSGNHGMEIDVPGMAIEDDVAERAWLVMADLRRGLEGGVGEIDGAFVEDKGVSLSVHFRMAAEELEARVQQVVRDATAEAVAEGRIIVVEGKKVLDIRPAAARDKGAALRFIMEALEGMSGAQRLPFYLGDDTTDEDAFREVNRAGGVSVFVGGADRDTEAAYRVDGPVDVGAFLSELAGTSASVAPSDSL